jgi:CheY-like chemotaxis protein
VCPLACEHGYKADGDSCTKIVCAEGSFLNEDNECVKRRGKTPIATRDDRGHRGSRRERADRAPREQPRPDDGAAPAATRRRILVVDDNRDAAESLAMLLELQGHDVAVAHDGHEAIAKAETETPEVVFLDIGMPRLNGYETARRMRERPWGRRMTLVALTGWGQDEDRQRTAEAGFEHHLTKPVEIDSLMRLLAGVPASDSMRSG